MTVNDATEKIRKTPLGTSGPLVGVQGFGAMGISAAYGQTDTAAASGVQNRHTPR